MQFLIYRLIQQPQSRMIAMHQSVHHYLKFLPLSHLITLEYNPLSSFI